MMVWSLIIIDLLLWHVKQKKKEPFFESVGWQSSQLILYWISCSACWWIWKSFLCHSYSDVDYVFRKFSLLLYISFSKTLTDSVQPILTSSLMLGKASTAHCCSATGLSQYSFIQSWIHVVTSSSAGTSRSCAICKYSNEIGW